MDTSTNSGKPELKQPIASEGEYADKFLNNGWRFHRFKWTNKEIFDVFQWGNHNNDIHLMSLQFDDTGQNVRGTAIATERGRKTLWRIFGDRDEK